MYNKLLDTFLTAADCGSFSKAAERLYISSTAVVKQINQLENETGLHLFSRTHHGVRLTDSGRALYEDAKFMIRYSDEALRRARQLEHTDERCIRVGVSVLRPGNILLDLWTHVQAADPDCKIHLVPFEEGFQNYLRVLEHLGQEIDVVASTYPAARPCSVLHLFDVPLCCAVGRMHRLAQREKLTLQDLYGETVMILQRGKTAYIDDARAALEQHPQIRLLDVPDYEMDTFNRCQTEGCVLLTNRNWAEVHTMLVTIPVDWHFTVPYGLLYAAEPSDTVRRFIGNVQRVQEERNGAAGGL